MKNLIETRAMPKEEEERNTLVEKMERLVDSAKKETRSFNSSEIKQFNQYKSRIAEIDRTSQSNKYGFGDMVEIKGSSIETRAKIEAEEKAFVKFVQTGETRDLASTNNGSMIPTSVASKITDKVFEISPLLQEATVYNVTEDLNLPVYDYSQHVSSFLQEFVDIVESSGTFASVPLKSKIIGTMSKIGKSLVNRTDIDVLGFIVSACAKSVARFLENEIILNTNNKFASTLLNGVTQATTTATTLVIAPEEVVRLKNSIPSIMLPNAKWLMHKDTLSYLQTLKDTTGQFLFGNSLSEGNGNVILGHEVMISDAMPRIGVGARQIYFGDFSEGLAIKMGVQSAEVYRELYAKQYSLGVGHFLEVDVSASHCVQAISVLVGK